MAGGPRRPKASKAAGLQEELKRLQAEVIAGLDSGDSDDGEAAAAAARRPGRTAAAGGGKPASAGTGTGGDCLSEEAILTATGEEKVDDVVQLILRGQQLTSLTTPIAVDFSRLAALEVLSLSNNCIVDIDPLASLVSLVEVNLNFNRISNISPLHECEQLEKIFAAHNEIESIAGLEFGCPQLRELSLFSNRLPAGRNIVQTLQGLPDLRALDIGENECCAGPSQRYSLLQSLPKLEVLDGQKLNSLDRLLARGFFEGAERGPGKEPEASAESEEASPSRRPCTAPATGSRPPLLPSAASSGGGAGLVPSSSVTSLGSLPGQRLRSSRSNRIDDVLTSSREPSPEDGNSGGIPTLDTQRLDPSDPEGALQRLAVYTEALHRHLEILQIERDNLQFEVRLLQREGREARPEGLREKVAALEEENRNLPAVEDERRQLQARLAEVERAFADLGNAATAAPSTPGPAAAPSAGDEAEDVLAELRWENQLLRKRLKSTLRYDEQLQEEELRARLRSGQRLGTSAESTAEEGAGGAVDPEIVRLVEQNEAGLRRLRGEFRDTATAMARRKQAEDIAPQSGTSDPNSVDVLQIGEGGVADIEWHGTR